MMFEVFKIIKQALILPKKKNYCIKKKLIKLKIKDEVFKLAINKIMSLLKSNNNNQE